MVRKLIAFIIIFSGFVYSQTIDETLQQIDALKIEIAQNKKLVEAKIADLKQSNPLFTEQDVFESDAEYLDRMSRAMPQLENLRKQYLGDLWQKLSILSRRMFETRDISVTMDKNRYDANSELWPIVVQHKNYQNERFEITINIKKHDAATLFKNWEKVQKTGILTIDFGGKIGLAKFKLDDPISGFEYTHEFQPMKSLPCGNVGGVAFSSDGKYLGVGSNRSALVYNLETDQQVKNFMTRGKVHSVAFSPAGEFLAVGSDDNALVYNLETSQEVKTFKTYGDVRSVVFSPDGKFLAVGPKLKKAHVYNLETGQEINTFVNGGNYSVAFSRDGKFLATASGDKNAHVYNMVTSQEVKTFQSGRSVRSVAFSPDGRFLAVGSDDNALVYNLETDQQVKSFQSGNDVRSVAFSPGGKYLAVGYNDEETFVYNLETGLEVKTFPTKYFGSDLSFSPDGKYLAAASSSSSRAIKAYIFRTLFQVEEEVLAKKAISRPPSLSARVSFSEPSGNQFLDALENGKFTLKITNSGQGPGKGVLAKITPERTDNLNYNTTYIEEIFPGKSVSVDISVEAYIGIADGDHTFRFDFEEINGFPPDPVVLQFSTKAYLKPEMYIVDVGIEDDNMNGKIESGEMINVKVRVGNRGKGTAKSAYAKFYPGDNVFITEKYPKIVKMGELVYNGFQDISLEFFVNDKTVDEIPLYVDFTEENNLANVSKLRLPIKKSERAWQIGRTVVTGIEQDYGILTLGADLSVDIEQDIPEGEMKNPEAVAIVIGNKNYTHPDVPEVTFAHRDAAIMEQYLTKALGYKEVIVETDATLGKFLGLFGSEKSPGKLQDYVKPGVSDVFIYYSGHGAPDPESKDGYFVPVDCDPAMVDVYGYSLDLFYQKINSLKAKSVTVVIDACFSGSSDQGMLLKNISPVFIQVDETKLLADDVTVFTSASGEQVSSWYPEKKHSLYTYFFLKGLKGAADLDGNKTITLGELQNYVLDQVPYQARKLNSREQTPGLETPNLDRVLSKY